MYSNLYQSNDKYILMEAALSNIDGIDSATVNAIIALHQTVYMPQFESVDGIASTAVEGGLNTYAIVGGVGGLISAITAAAALASGATAGAVAAAGFGLVSAVALLGWAVYDGYGASKRTYDEVKQTNFEEKTLKEVNAAVKANVDNNPYAKYAINAAKRTSKILSETGGTLLDKVEAVGQSASHVKADPQDTMDDDEFEEKYGFTKDLQIVDAGNALNHSLQYYYLLNGLNVYGNKVVNKEAYAEFMSEFNEYWEQHKGVLPTLDEQAAKAKMFPEFARNYYKDVFLPEFRRKLSEAIDSNDKNKTIEELESEGRDAFGTIVDKEKYYASMGFRPDGRLINLKKFSKAFTAKTGLDLSYNPVTPDGTILLERMLKDPSYEYMKYLPASVFLMTEEDQKPFIEKAKDPNRRGEIQFGRYANAVPSYKSASRRTDEQPIANSAVVAQSSAAQAANPSSKQVSTKQDITDAPDVVKHTGPWQRSLGKKRLADMYREAPDRHRHLMRLGYIMNIQDGKFYRMTDEDRKVMPQVVYDEQDEVSRKNAEERRLVKLRQGRLTNADMTEDEIAASNRRAGLPDDL